ncbi:MAG TPA: hypothetical protein VH186_00325 [Chloroflexia bacterium]|nr:hypothetical protein [Chloroflexia bacterium]
MGITSPFSGLEPCSPQFTCGYRRALFSPRVPCLAAEILHFVQDDMVMNGA